MDSTHGNADGKGLLAEYEDVENALRLLGDLTSRLKARQSRVASALDDLTRPETHCATASGPAMPSPSGADAFLGMGYVYRGKRIRVWGQTSIYLGLLRHVLTEMPDQREAVATALASHGSRRRYIARDRQSLYVGKSVDWVHRHSVDIVDGWFADKNLSGAQMRANLHRALQAVGLRMGTDVIINWHARWGQTH
jgi:hypothetical protein